MNDVYVVKSGDSLSVIAQNNNTTVEKLLELNSSITNKNEIDIGQQIQLPTSTQKKIINVLKKMLQYMKENTPDTLPEDDGTECDKKKPIEKEEVVLIVGTEQHSATYGNKMMFPAQAIREVNQNYSSQEYVTILIFTDGFNAEELTQVEESAISHNPNVNFIKINSTTELIKHINVGTSKITRTSPNSENHIVKIKTIKIFAHGLASTFDFGLDGSNRESQQFKINHVAELKLESFMPNPEIYSYACRTGNADTRLIASTPGYTYGSDWLEVSQPNKSLAQKLSDHLDAKVHAYLKRSFYTSTWDDGGDEDFKQNYEQIEDESLNEDLWRPDRWNQWDEALWNDAGAYASPTIGNTPKGLPKTMYIFEKNQIPRSK
jgi:LysM repeat protein